MMQSRQRGNKLWLAILSGVVGVAVLSGVTSPVVTAALLTLLVLAGIGTFFEIDPRSALQSVQRARLSAQMTPDAREAIDRATRGTSRDRSGIVLMDIGLITTETTRSGMDIRRGRRVTGDADGLRPYVTLHVDRARSDARARVVFEIIDQAGERQFIRQEMLRLREGAIDVVPTHHLPLSGRADLSQGGWELRVTIDDVPVAILPFTFSIGVRDRLRTDDEATPLPMSIEEMLRAERNDPRSSRRSS